MSRASLPAALLGLALAAAAGAAGGCFSPAQPACAFSCAVDHLCPTNYVCADDGFCHRADDGGGVCLLTPADAADDTAPADAGASAD
jgi:hypothetical protein